MTCVQQQVKVEMAIPMGGEHMDTSHYPVMEGEEVDKEPSGLVMDEESGGFVDEESAGFVDGEPGGVVTKEFGRVVDEEPVNNSYVSIKLKGAGRPIHIRMDESQLAKTQVISTVVADVYRLKNDEHELDARSREIADRRAGFSHKYTVSSEVCIESNKKKYPAVPVDLGTEREESIPDPNSAFTAQDEVVSIQNIIPGSVSHLNSDWRSSPGKVTRKQKTHGKESAPYIKQLLKGIQSGERHYIKHNGIKHLVQFKLIPVQEETASEETFIVHKHRIMDENAGGSVDRPPDSDFEQMDMADTAFSGNQPQMSASFGRYEYDRYGQMVAYPLDLSNKPLDLTVKKPFDSTVYQEHSFENPSSSSYNEENTDNSPLYDGSSMSIEARGEVGENHEYRDTAGSSGGFDDASSCYDDDGRVSVQSEDQFFGDGDCNPHVDGKLDVATADADRGDGNLPSLGRLTLYSKNMEGQPLENDEAKYAVSTHHVEQPSAETFARNNFEGPEGILNMLKSGLVTPEQLIHLYYKNQSKKVAALNNYASAKVLDAKVVAQVPHRSNNANGNLQTSEQSDVSNIPALAMPNFVTLEVANKRGELLVKEGEKVKLGLRDKLKKKNTSSS